MFHGPHIWLRQGNGAGQGKCDCRRSVVEGERIGCDDAGLAVHSNSRSSTSRFLRRPTSVCSGDTPLPRNHNGERIRALSDGTWCDSRGPVAAGARETVHMRDFDDLPVLITVPTAARVLGVSRASAYRYAELGLLPVKRFGGRIYIVRDRLRKMVEAT